MCSLQGLKLVQLVSIILYIEMLEMFFKEAN